MDITREGQTFLSEKVTSERPAQNGNKKQKDEVR